MEKHFDPKTIETRVNAAWERSGAFKAGRVGLDKNAEPFTIVIPPPNVTGSLHMGHALNNTLQDILCRYWRMKGKDVLWQPGTDHAGIATQMVVERQMMERQEPNRHAIGREKFLDKVWSWKAESGGAIVNQLKRLGASCDWSRERFTMGNREDGEAGQMQQAVIKFFTELDRKGLLYKDKRLVNWDPKLLTAISDLEVEQREVKGSFAWARPTRSPGEQGPEGIGQEKEASAKPFDPAALGKVLDREPGGHLYYFDYPIEGEVFDPENPDTYITVATTRPETMLGDTAVAVHPENEKLRHLIGKQVRLPLVGRLIPIIADDYADPEKGTGAVKITPAHDFNDFEVGKRAVPRLKVINIFDAEARVELLSSYGFTSSVIGKIMLNLLADASMQDPEVRKAKTVERLQEKYPELASTIDLFQGMPRFEARKKIVALMEAKNFLRKIEPHTHQVPHGDRSGVPIEPWITDQWYVSVKPLAEKAVAWVRSGAVKILPANRENDFFRWMENIEPWCISRQLWWGHQIPAWYGITLEAAGYITELASDLNSDGSPYPQRHHCEVAVDDKGALQKFIKYYDRPGVGPFEVRIVADEKTAMAEFEANRRRRDLDPSARVVLPIYRDPDVLDTWFSSALWPFSTLGWPNDTPELAKYYPTSVLVTAADILFFWVARMMMASAALEHEGKPLAPPFHTVYLHGLVRDEKGRKMSKSVGNVLDPLEVIDALGADALRFTIASYAAQGRDPKLGLKTAESYRNFCTKIWNASRFAEMNECRRVAGFDPRTVKEPLNIWAIGEADKALAEIEAGIENYRFNEAALAAYRFTWNTFCDWYVELAKPVLIAASRLTADDPVAGAAFQSPSAYVKLRVNPTGESAADELEAQLGGQSFTIQGEAIRETRATVAFLLDRIVAMLHPFMPYITEELFAAYAEQAGAPNPNLLCVEAWPTPVGIDSTAAEAEIGFIVDLITEIRSARSEMNVPVATLAPLVFVGLDGAAKARAEAAGDVLKRLARVSEVRFEAAPPPSSVQIVVRGTVACLPLEGIIDFAAEKKRLAGEREKLVKDVEGTMRKLDNPDFLARAPDEVIEENRERVAEAEGRVARIDEALKRLG